MRDSAGVNESQLTIQKITCVFDRNPVAEHPLVMIKTLGFVSLRDVDGVGASDMDNVGMQDVRKDCEAHLFERPAQLAEGFNLFSHWDEVDNRLKRTSVTVWIWSRSKARVKYIRTGGCPHVTIQGRWFNRCRLTVTGVDPGSSTHRDLHCLRQSRSKRGR